MPSAQHSDRHAVTNQPSTNDPVLRRTLSAIPEAILLIDDDGIVHFANPAAERLFGYAGGELSGLFLGALIPAIDSDGGMLRAAESNRGQPGEDSSPLWQAEGRGKNGTPIMLQGSVAEIAGGAGSFAVTIRKSTHDSERDQTAELLSRALDQTPDAALIVTPEGEVVYANRTFARLAGRTPHKSVNRTAVEWAAVERELAAHLAQFSGPGPMAAAASPAVTGGAIETGEDVISPVRNERGEITHFLILNRTPAAADERRRQLEESEQRFRKVAEMAGEWLWEQDPNGRYTYCSAAVFHILGYRPEEMQGMNYLDILTAEDRHHWLNELPRSPNIPRPFHRLINRYVHKDGHEVFTESSGEPLLDARGDIVKWWGVDHDITRRKRVEDALRLRDRAISAAHVGITILDARQASCPLIYVNPALCSMTGYAEDELLNRPHPFFFGPETDAATMESLRDAMAEGSNCGVTLKLYRRDRSSFWSDILISAVNDDGGRATHFIWIVSDITERKRAAEARRELETARQIQSSLLPKTTLRTDGLEAAGICLPAGEVGGDYFDYFATDDRVNLTIADVSGHNVGAALIMTETRSALRAKAMTIHAEGVRIGPSTMLTDLNTLLFQDLSGADLFITMLYLEFDRVTRRLNYASAGHNPGLLAHAGVEHCTLLDAEGLVMGVKPAVLFEEKSLLLKAGDVVLLYTDGVTEARNRLGELYGIERLSGRLIRYRHLPVEDLIRQLVQDVREFAAPAALIDDTSMVALKIL